MGEFKSFTKPPLGASPVYITAGKRVVELSKAITRAAEEGGIYNYTGHISMWAEEIIDQCKLVEKYRICEAGD